MAIDNLRRQGGGGGQKSPILRRHSLWTAPYWAITGFSDLPRALKDSPSLKSYQHILIYLFDFHEHAKIWQSQVPILNLLP